MPAEITGSNSERQETQTITRPGEA